MLFDTFPRIGRDRSKEEALIKEEQKRRAMEALLAGEEPETPTKKVVISIWRIKNIVDSKGQVLIPENCGTHQRRTIGTWTRSKLKEKQREANGARASEEA